MPRERRNGNSTGSSARAAIGAQQADADADQTESDRDQTSSDVDQTASDIDQTQSESDQLASDRDQATADRELGEHPQAQELRKHEASRVERAAGTEERAVAAMNRSRAASEREKQAAHRDEIAEQRDRTADERDRVAERADREEERAAKELGSLDDRFRSSLLDAEKTRARAAGDRGRAAADRGRAAVDRRRAARDRKQASIELELSHLDELTGAYRRDMGDVVLRHEVERAQRSGGQLVFAFVDVDGLKATNNRDGHAAGDDLLCSLMAAIRTRLRPYDPVVRVGGDEFLCALPNTRLDEARHRFEEIEETLHGASITVGLSEMRPGDTVSEMAHRSDAEMRRLREEA